MEQKLTFSKTFRYEIVKGKSPSKILYVLHGYGQLSKFFSRKFSSLPDDIMLVAPEGMHRFYLNGSSGRVGASWMTKEAREDDISDNVNWLNKLHHSITEEHQIDKAYLLGFSQGGATAARWQVSGEVHFEAMALWACVFPPDLSISELKKNKIPSFFLIGDQDDFYNKEQQKELSTFYKSLNYQIITYSGNHDIENETLTSLIRQMIK